jgi:prepilin-type N-terminal cleavage/methylation domain-containing protein
MKRFTLIELLVVVAIIGILISILLPSLGKAREYTKRAVCKSNLAQISKATISYTGDSNGYFPENYSAYPGNNWRMTITEPYNSAGHKFTKVGLLLKDEYLNELQVAYCPSNNWQSDSNSNTAGLFLDYETNVAKWDVAIADPNILTNFVNVNYEWRKGVNGPEHYAKVDSGDAFLADMFFEWYGDYADNWFHSIYGKTYWNVAYVDGAVNSKQGLSHIASWPQWNDAAQWEKGYFSE